MREVLPGVFHWTAIHPNIHSEVSSYWLDGPGVLIDPLVPPEEGLEWFAGRPEAPNAVLLSNRHHSRDSHRFAERFNCPVLCNSRGLHELSDGREVEGFDIGEELPGGVMAFEFGAICPDDTALVVGFARAVILADGVVLGGPHGQKGKLGFVPDSLMDDPPATKQALLDVCSNLLAEVDFDHLLLAHGGPVIDDARAQLQDLIDCGGRTAFEM
ncbi:MAG TPA: hypothetical protein VHT29_13865 [Solirubrobacteraceae bacterium]|jgi:hypothetical protein|nr:hypothetical protein [Solirubrobacteraceae bacterium]